MDLLSGQIFMKQVYLLKKIIWNVATKVEMSSGARRPLYDLGNNSR